MSPDFLDKIAQAYAVIDDRRRKAFNVMLTTTVIFILIGFSKTDGIKLPILGTELDQFLTLSLAPMFVGVLFGRYFYLCAHTLKLYIRYLGIFQKTYAKEIEELGWNFADVHNSIRMRDLTEVLNPFLFPKRFDRKFKPYLGWLLHYGTVIGHNFTTLMTVIAPVTAYFACVIWFRVHYKEHMNETLGMALFLFYIAGGIGMILVIIYFFYLTSGARSTYFERRYKVEGEDIEPGGNRVGRDDTATEQTRI